jgi:hypothetical protein
VDIPPVKPTSFMLVSFYEQKKKKDNLEPLVEDLRYTEPELFI